MKELTIASDERASEVLQKTIIKAKKFLCL
jgi:hypothetical protein